MAGSGAVRRHNGVQRSSGQVLTVHEERTTGDGMREILKTLWDEEEGQDLTEYALLVVLIALAAITSMRRSETMLSPTPDQIERDHATFVDAIPVGD